MTSPWIFITAIAKVLPKKATPLVFAALGGVLSENAGVVNIALEGIMAGGAFAAVVTSYYTHNVALSLVVALLAGAALAFVLAYFAIAQRADQIIVGMAINIFALGAAAYLVSAIFGQPGASPQVTGLRDESLLTWMAAALVVALHIFLYRTRIGIHLRAVGEEPRAAATAGINVLAYRYGATMVGGALAALGGAYLSVGETDIYSDGMVAGRGFIALAAVIFGKWTPFGAAGACVFFAFFSSLQIVLQGANLPAQLLEMLPYLLTIVAIAGFIGRARPPASDGEAYEP
ncbi:MAG TPA: ABC transporter permease [Casimicrobiaceae bacterium]